MKCQIDIVLKVDLNSPLFTDKPQETLGRIIRGIGSDLRMRRSLRPKHITLHYHGKPIGTMEVRLIDAEKRD